MDVSSAEAAPSPGVGDGVQLACAPSLALQQAVAPGTSPVDKPSALLPKPKQSKSRNGCSTCKARRLKCDETKPACFQCQRRKVVCGGYRKDFKWMSLERSNSTGNARSMVKKRSAEDREAPRQRPSGPGAPANPFVNISASDIARLLPGDLLAPHDRSSETRLAPSSVEPLGSFWNADESSLLGFTPPLAADALLPATSEASVLHPVVESQALSSPSSSALTCPQNDDVEEIVRSDGVGVPGSSSLTHLGAPGSRPGYPSPSLPSHIDFHADSSEMLLARFDQRTCGILSIKDGWRENPWRTEIMPLVRESPALLHALCALAAFHSTKEDPIYKSLGMDHMRQSIRTLALTFEIIRPDAALATTLALAFADTWDKHVSTGIQHFHGAKALFRRALTKQRHHPITHAYRSRLMFLYNSWMYVAVIAQLTSPENTGFDEISFPPDLVPQINEVDPLLGCAATLFPLIGRVAALVQCVRQSGTANSTAMINQALDLKAQIRQWSPPMYFQPPEDPTCDLHHSYQAARAYRWATLLHLHQAFSEIPSQPASELAHKVLSILATVPLSSRTVVIHIFPLLVASCEVDNAEDRTWIAGRWAAMQQRMAIGNVDRCFEVVCEVWRRRDARVRDIILGNSVDGHIPTFHPPDVGPSEPQYDIMEPIAFDPSLVDLEQEIPDSMVIGGDITMLNDTYLPSQDLSLPYLSSTPTMPLLEPVGVEPTSLGSGDGDYEVRRSSHWMSVMSERGWQVLLG